MKKDLIAIVVIVALIALVAAESAAFPIDWAIL